MATGLLEMLLSVIVTEKPYSRCDLRVPDESDKIILHFLFSIFGRDTQRHSVLASA